MKIISGKYKGRVLKGFDVEGTRPTMDRVKESLFGMIQNRVVGSTVLDLFSGSGNLGLEALSEGASFAYLVDMNHKAIEIIRKNISMLEVNNVEVLSMDYQKALRYLKEHLIKIDIVFLDPPYKTDYIIKSIEQIETLELLTEDGLIVCESDCVNKILLEGYQIWKEKKYGDKYIVILKKV